MVSPGQLRAIRPPAPNIRLDRETRKGSSPKPLPFLLPALICNRLGRPARQQGASARPLGTTDRASPSPSHSSVEPSVEQCPPAQKAVASPLPPPANLARCLAGSVPLMPASQQRIGRGIVTRRRTTKPRRRLFSEGRYGERHLSFSGGPPCKSAKAIARRHAPSRAVVIAIPAHELWHAH